MFTVGNVYLSDDVALARFGCNLSACGGACCVRGDAGAPVRKSEVPVIRKAWEMLGKELGDRSQDAVKKNGLVWGDGDDLELATVDGAECVFVEYSPDGTALCSIQRAYIEGRLNWIKPLSCHLYPLRILESGLFDYVNFEYIPEMCSSACDNGKINGIYLAEYLQEPLTRKYGPKWYNEFLEACRSIRQGKGVPVC